jgi:hypothetical protein
MIQPIMIKSFMEKFDLREEKYSNTSAIRNSIVLFWEDNQKLWLPSSSNYFSRIPSFIPILSRMECNMIQKLES